MKIPKSYVGKEARITWMDPAGKRCDWHEAKIGREALARWIERGLIDSIHEGVVRIVQSEAYSSGEATPDEGYFGWIPEELIEKCEILEVVAQKESE